MSKGLTQEEIDKMLEEMYTESLEEEIPSRTVEPPCICPSRVLIGVGHNNNCPYIKWRRKHREAK